MPDDKSEDVDERRQQLAAVEREARDRLTTARTTLKAVENLIPRALPLSVGFLTVVFLGVQGQVLQHRARRPNASGILGDCLCQPAHHEAHLSEDLQRVTGYRLVSQLCPHGNLASGPRRGVNGEGDGLAEFVVHGHKASLTTKSRQPISNPIASARGQAYLDKERRLASAGRTVPPLL